MSAIWLRTASTAPWVPKKAAPPMRATPASTRARHPQHPMAIQNTGERPFLAATGGAAIGGTGEPPNPPGAGTPGAPGGAPPIRGGGDGGGGGTPARGGSGGGPPGGSPGGGGGASGVDWMTVTSGPEVTMVAP